LKESLQRRLGPIAERRDAFARDPQRVDQILARGAERARSAAAQTMTAVRKAMRISP
jgi:tryptophanyl-tRNA synthetase